MSCKINNKLETGDRVTIFRPEEEGDGTLLYIKGFDMNEEFYVVKRDGFPFETESYRRDEIRKVGYIGEGGNTQ